MGLSSEVGLVEGGVRVFDVARPYVFAVAVDRVLACVAGPRNMPRDRDERLELVCCSLGYGFEDGFLGGFES